MDTKITVLFISDAGDKRGAQKSLMELIITLKENFQVVPIVLTKKRNNLNKLCDSMGIENYSFWYRYIMMSSPYNIKLINICKHIVYYFFYLIGAITKYKFCRIGLDFSKIDLIHTNTNRVDIGCYLKSKYHIPHIMHLRELGVEDFGNISYRKNVYEYLNKNVDEFIAISKCVEKAWIERGLSKEKVKTIYNGINPKNYCKSSASIDKKIKIVVAGAINKYKGQYDVVKALKLLPQEILDVTSVSFYGNGKFDYINTIKKFINDNNLESYVRFKGYSDNLALELEKYNIGIVSSKSEAFGRVTVEYMLCGVCVIASNTGANTELIKDGVNGFLYQYGEPESIAECIKKIYEDREKVKNMAEYAFSDAMKKYITQINANNIKNMYLRILSQE